MDSASGEVKNYKLIIVGYYIGLVSIVSRYDIFSLPESLS